MHEVERKIGFMLYPVVHPYLDTADYITPKAELSMDWIFQFLPKAQGLSGHSGKLT